MQDSFVKLDIEDAVATVTFFTPEHNALPTEILNKLEHTLLQVASDKEVYVIVLKSGGDRTFCAGASFKELIAIDDEARGKHFFMGFAKVIFAMRSCPQPVIVRVQGKTVGGGVGIAAAADYCLASGFASIKLSELSIGIGPFVIGPAVERKMGVSAFSQMTLNAQEFYTPEWAKTQGLFAEILESNEALDRRVDEFARHLASYNPKALQEAKRIFWEGTEAWKEILESRAETSGKLVLSTFTKEKLQSYKS